MKKNCLRSVAENTQMQSICSNDFANNNYVDIFVASSAFRFAKREANFYLHFYVLFSFFFLLSSRHLSLLMFGGVWQDVAYEQCWF